MVSTQKMILQLLTLNFIILLVPVLLLPSDNLNSWRGEVGSALADYTTEHNAEREALQDEEANAFEKLRYNAANGVLVVVDAVRIGGFLIGAFLKSFVPLSLLSGKYTFTGALDYGIFFMLEMFRVTFSFLVMLELYMLFVNRKTS